jgi:hypothetical protein
VLVLVPKSPRRLITNGHFNAINGSIVLLPTEYRNPSERPLFTNFSSKALFNSLFLTAAFLPVSAFSQCQSCVNSITLPASAAFSAVVETSTPETQMANTGAGYFALTLSGVSSGFSIGNQTYAAWCATWYNAGLQNKPNTYPLYSTYSPTLPTLFNPIIASNNMKMVNHILNNKKGMVADVQDAIWLIMTGTISPKRTLSPATTEMVNAAQANPNYIPNGGGVMAVIYAVDPGALATTSDAGSSVFQRLFLELPVPTSTQQCSTCINAITLPTAVQYSSVIQGDGTASANTGAGYFTLTLAGVPTNYSITNQNYAAWCAGWYNSGLKKGPFTSPIYSTYGSNFPTNANPVVSNNTFNMVNYILNNKQGTVAEVQDAIWLIMTGIISPRHTASPTTLALVAAAMGNPTYCPPVGGTIAMFLAVNASGLPATSADGVNVFQNLLFEVVCTGTTTQSLALICAKTTGQVDVPYSSALVASGGTGGYTYSLQSGSLPTGLLLNPMTGAITGTPTVSGSFSFTAKAVDSSGNPAANSVTSSCGINIAPKGLSLTCAAATSGQVAVPYNSSLVATGGVPGYTYSISSGNLPPGLSLDSHTGAITGQPLTAGAYPFIAKVVDSASTAATAYSSSCGITVAPVPTNPLSVLCAPGSGAVGNYFSATVPVTGGQSPYSFSVSSGALPTGLNLNSGTGVISGTPLSAGTFGYVVKVVDANNSVAYSNCTGSCTGGGSTVNVSTALTPLGLKGTSVAFMVNGVALNVNGYKNDGTPTALWTKNDSVTESGIGIASDVDHEINSSTFIQLDVTQLVATGFTNAQITLNSVQAGETYRIFGSNSPGMLGATLLGPSATANTLFAMPGYGTYKYIGIQAASGNIILAALAFTAPITNCSIVVVSAPTASCASISASLGVAITPVTLVGTGGAGGPYTFTAAGLPNGLTISSSGLISGTPMAGGVFAYTVTITDKAGNKGTINCSVTVTAPQPLSVLCAAGSGTVGKSFKATVPVTGGVAPYTFSIAAGALPGGLTLNSLTGAISGTPKVAGSFGYTVKVVDANNMVAYSSCTSSCSGSGAVVSVSTALTPLGLKGTSVAYSVNGVALTAYGYKNDGTPTSLWTKNDSSTESGLGIASDRDHEINTSTFIQLDVTQLVAAGFTNAKITLNSVQSGETFEIYGSNSLSNLGSRLLGPSSTSNTLISMPGYGTYKYIGVRAANANIILGALAFTSPATACKFTIGAASKGDDDDEGDHD